MTSTLQKEKKCISIISFGSRGDIQPFIAMGIALSKKYKVRVLSRKGHKSFFERFGLKYVEISTLDSEKIVRNNEGVRTSMMEGDASKLFQAVGKLNRINGKGLMENVIRELNENPPDLFLIGSLCSYFGYYAKYVMKLKVMFINLSTTVYNYNHAPFGLKTKPFGLHYYDLLKVVASMHNPFKYFDEIASTLGKPRLDSIISLQEINQMHERIITGRSSTKTIYCQSSLFRDILFPNANPKVNCYIGPCILDESQQMNFSNYDEKDFFGGIENIQKIDDFFQKDLKQVPIYMGWGSMLGNTPENMVLMAVEALIEAKERAIILGGYAELSMKVLERATSDPNILSYAKEKVLFVQKAAHENLFPRVKCIVHHGGSGTTQVTLRSGVPSIITPVFVDQFDHSYVINKLQIGIGFNQSLKHISAKDLASAIQSVTKNNHDLIQRCKEVATYMRKENGNQAMIEVVDHVLENDTVQISKNQVNKKLIAPEILATSISVAILSIISYLITTK